MNENFREFLERLRQEHELTDIKQAVDLRHIATLIDQSDQALYFHSVIGYGMPVVSGLFRSQRRVTLSMGCNKFSKIETRLRHGIDHPIAPRYLETAPHKEVIKVDDNVEWAIATRVQGDRDVFVIPGARAKPLDPSLPIVPIGLVPTGAKVGIDATIGEGIPRERFERISYAYADHAKIKDYVAGKADKLPATVNASADHVAQLAQKIYALIEKTPQYYSAIAERFADYDFQSITRALGQLHAEEKLWQDPRGRMCIRGSAFAARPPEKP